MCSSKASDVRSKEGDDFSGSETANLRESILESVEDAVNGV